MRRMLMVFFMLTLYCGISFCEVVVSPDEELSVLYKNITEIANRCKLKPGTSQEEVEKIFGKGVPFIEEGKSYCEVPESPNHKYEIYKDGYLHVAYMEGKVESSHVGSTGIIIEAGRYYVPPIEVLLSEAKRSLAGMQRFEAAFLQKIASAQVLKEDEVIMGKLGKPVGTEMTVEGLLNMRMGYGLSISKVDDKEISPPVEVWVYNLVPIPFFPENTVCRVVGFESVINFGNSTSTQIQMGGERLVFLLNKVIFPENLQLQSY